MAENWVSNWNVEVNKPLPPAIPEDDDIIREAKARFKICVDWEATARINFEFDYKFANADTHNKYQWDADTLTIRDGRPSLTINKTNQHNLMVINDAKQNKPGVRIRPVGEEASYDAAQLFQEIIYHIEYISNAESIYDSALTFQVEAGIGYWRVNVEAISNESFDQEIKIQRIKDPRSVYLDPNINEIDGSDAWFGFIFDDEAKDLFRAKYPEYEAVTGKSVLGETSADGWITNNTVRVCEYYRRTQKQSKLVTWVNGNGGQVLKKLDDLEDNEKEEYKVVKGSAENKKLYQYQERKILIDDVQWFKIAGDRIVDRGPWLGDTVPIVRLVGTETVIDGILDRKGHTRQLIDPQKMYNWNAPISLDTPLPTPSGWTTMGEVKEGDWLIDENGEPVLVIGKSQIHHNRKCYQINFDNDSSIIADSEHLWTVEERGKRKSQTWNWQLKTLTTKELEVKKHFIAVTKALDLPDIDLPIHPYVLGAWLGDGSTAVNVITSHIDDYLNLSSIITSYGYEVGRPRIYSNSTAAALTIHGLRHELVKADVLDNKHIPAIYLRASREQRELLLRGLMDTDGHFASNNNQCVFINNNKRIVDGVIELLRSLGIKSKTSLIKGTIKKFPNGSFYITEDFYRVAFTADPDVKVFNLARKSDKQTKVRNLHSRRTKRHNIVSITEVSSVPVQCIVVKSESHLFLAGLGMVPTHNSADVEYGALQSKIPYVAPSAAIEGFEEIWKTANSVNHSYLPVNHIDDDGNPIPLPQRQPPPQPSPAYVQRMQISINEMMMASGQYQSQTGENENAKSGVAINARQRQGDRATYHFIDNQAMAIRRTGKIIIQLAPKIYDTKRVQRITASDGTIINMTIDPNAPQAVQEIPTDEKDKEEKIKELIFNPNIGTYDIQSDTGPSFATRRMEAFAAMTTIAAQSKEFMERAGDIYFDMGDFPKAQALSKRWKKFLPPNIANDGPDPQIEAAMHAASDKIEQLTALATQQAQQLKDQTRQFELKEHELELKFREAKSGEARGDYDAETKRVVALGNAGPAISIEQIQPVLDQLLRGMIANGELVGVGIGEGGTSIVPPEKDAVEGSEGQDKPPVEGAKKASDGQWYIEQNGQHYRVE